jgi:hypothetical protein
MKQLKVGLTDQLRQQLEAETKKSLRTLSDEIRQRLESSLADARLYPGLKELGEEVAQMAQFLLLLLANPDIEVDDAVFFSALEEAVKAWLELNYKPAKGAQGNVRQLLATIQASKKKSAGKKSAADPKTLGQAAASHLFMVTYEL